MAAKRHVMTAKRRAALRKAQLASVRKRRGRGKARTNKKFVARKNTMAYRKTRRARIKRRANTALTVGLVGVAVGAHAYGVHEQRQMRQYYNARATLKSRGNPKLGSALKSAGFKIGSKNDSGPLRPSQRGLGTFTPKTELDKMALAIYQTNRRDNWNTIYNKRPRVSRSANRKATIRRSQFRVIKGGR